MPITDQEQPTNVDLEAQFEFYLSKVGLKKETMPAIQIKELRRAFYGAFGAFIAIILRGFAEKPDQWAELALTSIEEQVKQFWIKEREKHQSFKN